MSSIASTSSNDNHPSTTTATTSTTTNVFQQLQFNPPIQQPNDVIEINDDGGGGDDDDDDGNNNESDSDDHDSDDSDDREFKKTKIPRLDKDEDVNSKNNQSTDDGEICTICFEPWTNSGEHRLVCLRCGHLFGESCIERWIKTNPKCPQCNRASKRSDIRRLYAKTIKAIDTAELDKALKDIESEKVLRKKSEINAAEMKLKYELLLDDYNKLKDEYYRFKNQVSSSNYSLAASSSGLSNERSSNGSILYGLDKLINITELSGCRVVSFSSRTLALLVSQQSNSTLFPGYGIKKINFLDYKLSQYVPVHSKLIRDMCINTVNDDGIILTCGVDKMIKLTNIANNTHVHSYECPMPIWSCAYNLDNPIYFYAGLQNGHVLKFDKRKIDKYVETFNTESSGTPVTCLQYVPKNYQSSFQSSGLLVSQLDKLCFYENKNNDEYKYHPLLIEGNLMHCSFEPVTRHLMISTRPNQKYPNVRHLVYELTSNMVNGENVCSINLIQTNTGANVQKILAKTKLFYYNSQLQGIVPDEPSKSAFVWDISKNETVAKLANTSEIYDVCPIMYNNTHYISTLTEKQLRVFKRNVD